jgi:hypothetical protein
VETSTAAARAVPPALAVTAATPAAQPVLPGRAPALTRAQGAASHLVPYLQYHVARLGLAGQVGLAALTAAVVIAVGTLLPAQHALQTLSADLAHFRHAPAATEQAVPQLIASLPTRGQIPLVIGQFAAEAKAAGVSLETGRYVYTAPKGGSIARYDLEFPVKASYPDIRTFIDHALTAVPAAALGKLRVERKAVGDPVVNADIDFVVFVRSGEQP